jgi:calcium-dependent protein kinase
MGCNKSLPTDVITRISCDPSAETLPLQRPNRNRKRIPSKVVDSINQHFRILKAIGTNSLGTLLYAQDTQTETYRAIREVSKNMSEDLHYVQQEIEILSMLDHPNIQKVFQTIETPINYYTVFEYLNGGTLRSRIKRAGNELLLARYMHDVISAVNYLHLKGVVHLDLTPTHVLFVGNGEEAVGKIISFVYAQMTDQPQPVEFKNLSYIYTAPDVLKKNFNEKADIWSLGIMIYELLVGKYPYLSKDKRDILKEIYQGKVDFDNQGFLQLSFHAQDLIRKMLDPNPDNRLSAQEALSHPWLGLITKEYYMINDALMRLRSFKVTPT